MERDIERDLVKKVRKRGGAAYKFVSPGASGVPDRIVLFEHGKMAFIELKDHGKKMRPLQEKQKRKLRALGFLVFTVDSKEEIEEVLNEIQST